MPDVIQCPTCSKKFKLPERPPAVFTCTGCGTAMDLSGFRPAAPAAAPAEPAEPAASADAGEPAPRAASARSSSRGGAASGSRTRSRSASKAGAGGRSRRGRGGEDDDADGDEGGHGRLPPPKKNNPALLWGSIGGVVVALVLVVVLVNRKGPAKPPVDEPKTGTEAAHLPGAAGTGPAGTTPPAMGAAGTDAAMGGPTAATTSPAPTDPPKHPGGKVQLHEIGYHPDTTEEEKTRIDKLVNTAVFVNEGADSRRAEKDLIAIGMKAAPRLVNVFNTVHAGKGFDDPQEVMKCAIADRVLRGIDGWLDRRNHGRLTLMNARSEARFVENIAKAWTTWWDSEAWKEPKAPWDEAKEGNRGEKPEEPAMGDAPTPMDGGGGTPDGR